MREVYKVADPKQIGIHIEPRPNLDIFVYTDGQRRWKMKRYTVELYDKDADDYRSVYSTDDLNVAKEVAESFNTFCMTDSILNANGQPFDWAEVYDELKQEVI